MLPLRAYQRTAIDGYINSDYCYLAADAGLGKSRIAIEIAKRLKAHSTLVICPASVKISWIGQLDEWSPASRYHAPVTPNDVGKFKAYAGMPLWTIINYDKLSRGELFLQKLIETGPYDLLVIDEAHATKSLTSKRTRAIFRHLIHVCKKVLPMSATPMTRCASDLYVPLRFMKPETITNKHGHIMTLHEFEDKFCQVEMKRVGPRLVREVKGARNMPELKERMGGFFLRMLKADHLPELPPMQFVETPIGLDREAYAPIAEVTRDIDISDDDLLNAATSSEHIMRAMRMIGEAKATPAAQYIRDYLDGNELKCVVWAKHHSVLDALCEMLSDFNPAVIDGRVDMKGRTSAIKSFLEDPTCRIMVGQIAAAGVGLTLLSDTVQPRDVFFVESDWAPSLMYQAASRVHRLGMRDGVLVRIFVAQGVELDQRIQAVLTRKTSECEQLIDGAE